MEGGNKLGGGAIIYNTMVLVFLKKGQRFLRDEEVTSHLMRPVFIVWEV